jgi:hypothetical protein
MTEPSTEMAGEAKPADDSASEPKPKQMRTIVLTGLIKLPYGPLIIYCT